jgi:hypothetical protein
MWGLTASIVVLEHGRMGHEGPPPRLRGGSGRGGEGHVLAVVADGP